MFMYMLMNVRYQTLFSLRRSKRSLLNTIAFFINCLYHLIHLLLRKYTVGGRQTYEFKSAYIPSLFGVEFTEERIYYSLQLFF